MKITENAVRMATRIIARVLLFVIIDTPFSVPELDNEKIAHKK
jgi:hypothetical protein